MQIKKNYYIIQIQKLLKNQKYGILVMFDLKGVFIISILKKSIIHLRTSIKLIIIVSMSILLIIGAVALFYKPIYSVYYNEEFLGYCENKSEMQKKISEYIQKGSGENVAFVQLSAMPEYKLCLLKKDIQTSDEKIYNNIISTGVTYYRYYAVLLDTEEKFYVETFKDAEDVISQLKIKNSNNIDSITVSEKYSTELKAFSGIEECVAGLYEKKIVKSTYKAVTVSSRSGSNMSGQKIDLGISLINPVEGIISSPYGWRWGRMHTGIDIRGNTGTPIYAAAGGTVVSAGYSGSYGNLVVISHGNGVQTYYAHASALYVSAGQTVSQGQNIAARGSTGRSTGPHLHFEVRINGTAQNPRNYVY